MLKILLVRLSEPDGRPLHFCENQPLLSVSSTIFGSGDTGGKTSLKKILVTAEGPGDQTIRYSDPKTGQRLDYPVYNEDGSLFSVEQPPVSYTGSAVLRLFAPDVDDSKIDSSRAVVKLLPGDGYYADELVLKAGQLPDGPVERRRAGVHPEHRRSGVVHRRLRVYRQQQRP